MKDFDQQLFTLFQNPDFQERANNIQSVEELQRLFANYGVDMTFEQVNELCLAIGKRAAQEADGELTEDALDDVAGGIGIVTLTCIGVGVLCIGAFCLGVYNSYKGKKK